MRKQSNRTGSDNRTKYSLRAASLTVCTLAAAMAMGSCGQKQEADMAGADTAGTRAVVVADSSAATDNATGGKKQPTRLEFKSAPEVIRPGEPATWTLQIVDQISGAPVKEFSLVHEKLMHLIVVSKDLTWFNHLHPEYKGDGVFTISAVLPKAGSYKLYADHTPTGGTQVVSQHELTTEGATSTSSPAALTADAPGTGGWIAGKFTSAPEGEPEKKGGATYEIALMPMPTTLVAGKDMMLHFQVRDAAGKPITDIEPYLGALGHLVIISSDATAFLHAHPMDGGMESMAGMDHSKMDHGSTPAAAHNDSGSAPHDHAGGHEHAAPTKGGPDVIFHTNFPQPGLYKLWGQFQHKGRIITASFTVNVGAAA